MGNANESLIGRQLGIYQIQAPLGLGGMAQVYKAYHPRLRREVAIKVILPEIAGSAGFQERFEREAQMIASLEHPNIVSVYDFGEEGDLTYLVMQYVGGGTLRDQLRGKRPLEPQQAARYAAQMALALHHAHQRGIIHRDVKPQNMLVSSTDATHLLLSDFGIAKLSYQGGEDAVLADMPTRNAASSSLTSASQIIGTADYMAPEQASGQAVDARTDVYALGIVLYQMLAGDIPFHSTTLQGLLFQHVYTAPLPISAKNPHVPEILEQITARALAKAPADRFPSAEALARALEQANMHATRLASFAQVTPPGTVYPPVSTGGTTQWAQSTQSNDIEKYATIARPQKRTERERFTSAPGIARPVPGPEITGIPQQRVSRRRFPLSYVLAALLIIASLVIAGLHFLPALTSSTSTSISSTTANNNTAQAFHEQFQDNQRQWLTGTIATGVTASTPGAGSYAVTITHTSTAFLYPQAVGNLPDNFTFQTTLQQTTGAADNLYGIAFHFTEDSSGHVNSYALAIDGNGQYELYKYANSTATIIASGTYQAGTQAHTLKVQARGSSYTFFIDNQALYITGGSTSWTNNDLHSGRLTLFFAGPRSGETTVAFKATDVQLSLS